MWGKEFLTEYLSWTCVIKQVFGKFCLMGEAYIIKIDLSYKKYGNLSNWISVIALKALTFCLKLHFMAIFFCVSKKLMTKKSFAISNGFSFLP